LGEDKQTIEEVYEPYLLKEGLILRTPRGRTLSDKANKHLS
jgi:Holliday junction DNA helicase RuvB